MFSLDVSLHFGMLNLRYFLTILQILEIFINKNNSDWATVIQEMKCSGFVKHSMGGVICLLA